MHGTFLGVLWAVGCLLELHGAFYAYLGEAGPVVGELMPVRCDLVGLGLGLVPPKPRFFSAVFAVAALT